MPSNEIKTPYFKKRQSYNENIDLKSNYPFLKEVDKFALESALDNLNDSYSSKQNKYPKFKSKKNKVQSYTTKFTL